MGGRDLPEDAAPSPGHTRAVPRTRARRPPARAGPGGGPCGHHGPGRSRGECDLLTTAPYPDGCESVYLRKKREIGPTVPRVPRSEHEAETDAWSQTAHGSPPDRTDLSGRARSPRPPLHSAPGPDGPGLPRPGTTRGHKHVSPRPHACRARTDGRKPADSPRPSP